MAAKGKVELKNKLAKKLAARLKKTVKYVGYKWLLPAVYRWHSRKPINDRLVVFADLRDRDMPDNFLSLYELCERDGYQCEVLSGRSFSNKLPNWQRRKAKLRFHFQFIKLYAQCRTLFLVEHFPLSDIAKPRPGTQVVQLWHGCGLMKRMGYAVTSKAWGAGAMSEREKKRYPMHTAYTLASISSAGEREIAGYCEAFHSSPQIVKPLGVPRTDIYFDDGFRKRAEEKVRLLFPEIGGRKIILYAPTFRGKSIAKSYIKYDLNFKRLKECLSDRYALITKFHPLMAKSGLPESGRLQGRGFVFDGTELLTPEEALCAADILVTDYSSIIFEYYLLERPVISYIYDIDKYDEDRGLFFPYDQLAPGPYVFDQEELTEKLLTVEEWFDVERVRALKNRFMSACDGHSTQRIYDYVFHRPSEKGGKPS